VNGRPLIGISSYLDTASWGVWQMSAALIPQIYVTAVTRAGGVAVVLPPQESGARETVAALDGLVLAGGPDLDPSSYNEAPHPRTGTPNAERDAWEFDLLSEALEQDIPILGVCRGMELLNVARGGRLIQHLPDNVGDLGHQPAPAVFGNQIVRVRPSSRLATILGHAPVAVRCYHHQAVGKVGVGLLPAAWCGDETVEAVEMPDREFVFGVQWHPETDPTDTRLFDALVEAAGKRSAERKTGKV
jgi:anthranilate synthase component 2/putative glutamine amidotransferase